MVLELVWIDALDYDSYSDECRSLGIEPDEDFDVVDPARYHWRCSGPFRRVCDSGWFGDLLPPGWVPADDYNWCTDILFRDGSGRLIMVATDWDEDHFDGSCKDYPVVYTGGDPGEINTISRCAEYIEKYEKEIEDWYSKRQNRADT